MFKPQDGIRRGTGQAPEWRHVAAKISATTPVLGHVSLLTAMLLLDDVDDVDPSTGTATLPRIITADRDEHVRVSRWPQGWRIERFLLGQEKWVCSYTDARANSADAYGPHSTDLSRASPFTRQIPISSSQRAVTTLCASGT